MLMSADHTKKILVIDDDKNLRAFMNRLLVKEGYIVFEATDGSEAVKMLEEITIDLIVLDMNMPRMNGLDFLKHLKSNNINAVPVLMMSGSTEVADRVMCYELGVYDFIQKPEDNYVMLQRIKNGLNISEMLGFNHFIKIELMMAKKMQKYLYPEINYDGEFCSLRCWTRPLSDVGGDLYDYIVFRDGRIIILVADVSGHSISAAMYTAIVKMVFRNALRICEEPALILQYMNDELYGNIPIESFITAFCCVYDPKSGIMEYANGGHPNPYLVEDNKIDFILGNDALIGPINDSNFQSFTREIPKGAGIFIHTDGIMDLILHHEAIGKNLFEDIIQQNDLNLYEKFDSVSNRIINGDHIIIDDCTVLMLHRFGE
jgi:serine phosphatase RsbU (regulator of sigma subunit)